MNRVVRLGPQPCQIGGSGVLLRVDVEVNGLHRLADGALGRPNRVDENDDHRGCRSEEETCCSGGHDVGVCHSLGGIVRGQSSCEQHVERAGRPQVQGIPHEDHDEGPDSQGCWQQDGKAAQTDADRLGDHEGDTDTQEDPQPSTWWRLFSRQPTHGPQHSDEAVARAVDGGHRHQRCDDRDDVDEGIDVGTRSGVEGDEF